MHKSGKKPLFECVLIDLNTQVDFCHEEGRFPVVNVQELIPALRRVIAWAKRNHAPIISSIDSHRQHERPRNGCAYCVDDTPGQRKLDFTIFPFHTRVEVDNTLAVPLNLFKRNQQVIFRERSTDLLDNPKADRFINVIAAREFIVFGNATETAVKALALGLLARHRNVTIIKDACGHWEASQADFALRQLDAKGARVIRVEDLLRRRLAREYRYRVRYLLPDRNGVNGHAESAPRRAGEARNGASRSKRSRVRHADLDNPVSSTKLSTKRN